MERNTQRVQTTQTAASTCADGQGKLTACAPLANPYVPYQMCDPEKYAPAAGLIRGTMYPGLDLPFMGMVNKTEKTNTLLHQIQALSFATVELGLYLDTHAEDAEALDLFNQYKELYGELMAEYEAKSGPITQIQSGGSGVYNWTDDPWPWDYDANAKEG